MTLNELIAVLQDHAKGEPGYTQLRMVSADTGAKIELKAIQSVRSTPVGGGAGEDEGDYVRLVFRTEPR